MSYYQAKLFGRKIGVRIKQCLVAITLLYGFVILFFSSFNEKSYKYSGASIPDSDCKSLMFIRSIPNSEFCCTSGMHRMDWVCVAFSDPFGKILASKWAWILPLFPFVMNFVIDIFVDSHYYRFVPYLYRLGFYVFLFFYRTVVLYFLVDGLSKQFQYHTKDCWYSHLVSRCKEEFDYSDHLVLFYVQYLIPISIEMAYSLARSELPNYIDLQEFSWKLSQGLENAPEVHAELLRRSRMYQIGFYFLTAFTVIYVGIILRSVVFTCLFFHSMSENISGFTIALFGSAWILLVAMSSTMWYQWWCPYQPSTKNPKVIFDGQKMSKGK